METKKTVGEAIYGMNGRKIIATLVNGLKAEGVVVMARGDYEYFHLTGTDESKVLVVVSAVATVADGYR